MIGVCGSEGHFGASLEGAGLCVEMGRDEERSGAEEGGGEFPVCRVW